MDDASDAKWLTFAELALARGRWRSGSIQGASDQLRIASVTQRRSIQQIMEEALDDWFEKHRLPRLSAGTVVMARQVVNLEKLAEAQAANA